MSASPLSLTVAALADAGVSHAVFGAMAMPTYGVARATLDLDLLVFDRRALEPARWDRLTKAKVAFSIRTSDDDSDPIVGVVRIGPRLRLPIDVVMPRGVRHAEVLERAGANPQRIRIGEVELSVVELADLVLMKLDAGGPGDRDDARRLIASADANSLRAVQDRVATWPKEVRLSLERLLAE